LYGTILNGITRRSALQILSEADYDVEEYPITIDELVAAYKKGTLQEAFGAGTAAVVSHISDIAYKDVMMTLPPVSQRKVGSFIKSTIDGLRSGRVKDTYGWVVPVKEIVEAAVV